MELVAAFAPVAPELARRIVGAADYRPTRGAELLRRGDEVE